MRGRSPFGSVGPSDTAGGVARRVSGLCPFGAPVRAGTGGAAGWLTGAVPAGAGRAPCHAIGGAASTTDAAARGADAVVTGTGSGAGAGVRGASGPVADVVGRSVVGRFVLGRFVLGRFVLGRFVLGRSAVGASGRASTVAGSAITAVTPAPGARRSCT